MLKLKRVSLLLIQLIFLGATWADLPPALDEQAIRAAALESFLEYLSLLALPNDSIASAKDIQTNANQVETLFKKRGFLTKQFANNGKPLVLAEFAGDTNKKTILFYIHFDGQPVVPSQWSQPSPWQPVLKKKSAQGQWQTINMDELMRVDFDPELRVFARSASDDKGPIMMFLACMDLMKSKGLKPAINIKVILDGEEEVNSPGIPEAVKQNKEFLKADALVIFDMASHPSGRPTAIFGNRGVQSLNLTVYGPRSPLHSGHYGNYVPNPAFNLARLLASMKNERGQVLIPGYYATTKLTEEDLRVLDAVGDDELALKKRVGIAGSDQIASNYQRALQYPSLNIRGLSAGGVGKEAANIIPKEAIADIDIRTTTEANAQYLNGLIKKHIEQQGFHIIDHAPSDAERAQYPLLVRLEEGLPAEAARQPIDTTIRAWVEAAQVSAYSHAGGAKPVIIRASGATVPTHEIVGPLGLPFVIVPTVNTDNNQHAYDENLRMGNYLSGMRTMLGLINTPYK
jgi:acetylornithine deacetylase/succinyl-diaminopimelate desuccinylase-like protein